MTLSRSQVKSVIVISLLRLQTVMLTAECSVTTKHSKYVVETILLVIINAIFFFFHDNDNYKPIWKILP